MSLKRQLIGTWMLASWEQKKSDGTKVQRYGENPVSIAIHIGGRSFPNWNGADQKRTVAIAEDRLTLTVRPPTEEFVDVVWKHAPTEAMGGPVTS